ncbi:hypothetical protein K449DRAFT_385482 [Hypoxylon sp. EC38]|nr:hypothetical protein K449DRAFT_385482 [Hypoxylon sp. EC38]
MDEGSWWDTTGTGGPLEPIDWEAIDRSDSDELSDDTEMNGETSHEVAESVQELPIPLDKLKAIASLAEGNANIDAILLGSRGLSIKTGRAEDEPDTDIGVGTTYLVNGIPENGPEFATDSRRIRPGTFVSAPNRKPPFEDAEDEKARLFGWLENRTKDTRKDTNEEYLENVFKDFVETHLVVMPTEQSVRAKIKKQKRRERRRLFSLKTYLPSTVRS